MLTHVPGPSEAINPRSEGHNPDVVEGCLRDPPTSPQRCCSLIPLSQSGVPPCESVYIQGFKGKHVEIKLVCCLMGKAYNYRIGKMSRRQHCRMEIELPWNWGSWFCHRVTLHKLLKCATLLVNDYMFAFQKYTLLH